MKKYFILATLMIVLVIGCVPSIHPLYDEKTLYYTDALLGKWQGLDDDEQYWTFEKYGEKSYKLMMEQEGEITYLEAHLVKLEDEFYIDLQPIEDLPYKNDFYNMHFLPVHTFARFKLDPTGSFTLEFINYNRLQDLLEKGKIRVKHEKVDDDYYVLTASTKELQAFIIKYSSDAKAFEDASEFSKM